MQYGAEVFVNGRFSILIPEECNMSVRNKNCEIHGVTSHKN
jgi:hypothetical protein